MDPATEGQPRPLFSVGELAKHLGGEIVNCPERSEELVENLMLGALSVDSGLDYFRRKTNKAVIARGDRPDLQMAALETSTKCLILSLTSIPSLLLGFALEGSSPKGQAPLTIPSSEALFEFPGPLQFRILAKQPT